METKEEILQYLRNQLALHLDVQSKTNETIAILQKNLQNAISHLTNTNNRIGYLEILIHDISTEKEQTSNQLTIETIDNEYSTRD